MKRVREEGTDDDGYVYAIGEKKKPMSRLEIDGEFDEVTYERIYKGKAKTLELAKRQIFSYRSPTPLPLLEYFRPR